MGSYTGQGNAWRTCNCVAESKFRVTQSVDAWVAWHGRCFAFGIGKSSCHPPGRYSAPSEMVESGMRLTIIGIAPHPNSATPFLHKRA